MVFRVGADIIHIPRIAQLLSNPTALSRIFSSAELKNKDPSHLAGIFAAKEAVFKALDRPPRWQEIEISSGPSGRPVAALARCLPKVELDISISHDGDYAMAVAIVTQG